MFFGMNDKMKTIQMMIAAANVLVLGGVAWAAPMSLAVRTVIPSNVQQIISVDYGTARKFDGAMMLKAQALPDNLKKFEDILKELGVYPDKDVTSIVFASFDSGRPVLSMMAAVSGSFTSKAVLTELERRKVKPVNYQGSDIYPVSNAFSLSLLDQGILLLGEDSALRTAFSARDHSSNVDTNPQLAGTLKYVEKATVWSVLDQQGTQKMLRSVLGDAARLPEFVSIESQVMSSRYFMNFRDGLNFETTLSTSDNATATKLSALLKLGVLFKRVTANPQQRIALEDIKVTSNRFPAAVDPNASTSGPSYLRIEFKADKPEFDALLHSQCFTATSSERKELSGVTSDEATDPPKSVEGRFRRAN
jgi:hypothetical protein